MDDDPELGAVRLPRPLMHALVWTAMSFACLLGLPIAIAVLMLFGSVDLELPILGILAAGTLLNGVIGGFVALGVAFNSASTWHRRTAWAIALAAAVPSTLLSLLFGAAFFTTSLGRPCTIRGRARRARATRRSDWTGPWRSAP